MTLTNPTLIFDLSEVIISGIIGIEKHFAPMLGLDERTTILGFSGEPLIAYSLGQGNEDDYIANVLARSDWSLDPLEIKQVIRENFLHEVAGMVELVTTLASAYDLVLFSDHARDWIAYIEMAHPFMRCFTHRLYSYELKLLKRDPGAFEKALAIIGRDAADCIFIDDHQRNVDAALNAGLRAIRFTDRASLIEALARYDISP